MDNKGRAGSIRLDNRASFGRNLEINKKHGSKDMKSLMKSDKSGCKC
jgi:hypothetical protein